MALNQNKNIKKRASHIERITPRPWAKRRLRLDLALVAILVWISWIIFFNKDTVLYQQVSIALIAGGVTLIGQYVFGATWDDKNYMSALNRQNETLGTDETSSEDDTPPADTEQPSQIPDGKKEDTE
jgi:hypothetical protein